MFRTVRVPTAAPSGSNACPRILSAAVVALSAALAGSPAFADSDYPPGLFEHSPVVGPGGQAINPPGPNPAGPADGAEPGSAGPADPYAAEPGPAYPAGSEQPYAADAGTPYAAAPRPPAPIAPTDEFCDGIGMRTFASIEDVRRAHAVCDHHPRVRLGY